MKPLFLAWLGLTAWLCTPVMLCAQTPISYTQDTRPIFTVSMPDFWVARSGGPRILEDPDLGPLQIRRIIALQPETNDTAWIGLSSPEGIATLDAARAYVANMGQFLLSEPVIRNSFQARFGGLPANVVNGEGTREGRRLRFSVVMVDLPDDRVAILVALATLDADPGVIAEINAVLQSLKAGG